MLRFKPYPGLTIACAMLFVLLCGLGVWQVQRLHWKLDLIARIQQGLSAPARPLQAVWTGDAAAMDYTKVSLHGHFRNDQEVYFFATGSGGAPDYHVLTPFVMDSGTILVDRGAIPAALMAPQTRPAGQREGEVTLVGILRRPDAPNIFTPRPDIARRVTYTRDPSTVAAIFHLPALLPAFLEADAARNPGGWPKGGQTVVDLPNNHLSYVITWFGLAICLIGVWLAYHIQKARITWK